MRAAIELVDDFEYRLLAFRRRGVRSQKHPNAQMRCRTHFFRDQGVRCFLHTIVQESIRIVRAEDKSGPYCFPKMLVKFLDRLLVSHGQHVELGTVSHAGELLQCLLCVYWEAVQLSDHELDDIVGVALGVNTTQVPRPLPFPVVKGEQTLISERRNELNCEERIPSRPLMNECRQRIGAFRLAAKGVQEQLKQVVASKWGEDDVLHRSSALADRIKLADQRVSGIDLVVSIRPNQHQVL